jgi:hypothetical protein
MHLKDRSLLGGECHIGGGRIGGVTVSLGDRATGGRGLGA